MTRTKPKKLLSLLFSSLVVIGVVALIFKLTSKPVSAAWYDDSWQYRTKIVITNTGSAVSNQKVKFDIATNSLITASKIQSDCGDSRFVSSTGEILRYYLDTAGGACNTASTDYYVLIPSINVGSVVLYHYYGNPSATNGTEGANFAEATFTPNSSSTSTEEKGTSPIAYWKFDEGVDNSCPSGNDICNQGAGGTALEGGFAGGSNTPAWTTSGKFGKAVTFTSAQGDFATSADNTAYQFGTDDFTISAWVNPATVNYGAAAQGTIISKNYTGFELSIYQGTFISFVGGASNSCTSGTVFTTGTWYHVLLTRSGSTLKGYVNGKQVCTATNSANASNASQDVYVGVRPGDANSYLNGTLDELKIYRYSLSETEIKIDYNRGSITVLGTENTGQNLTDGAGNAPTAYWQLNEKIGQTVNDTSSNGYNGTLGANSSAGSDDPRWVPGKIGGSLNFDGNDDSVATADIDITGGITINAWIKTSSSTSQVIVRKTLSYELAVLNVSDGCGSTGTVLFLIGTGATWGCNSTYSATSTITVNDGNWHYVTGTFDDATNTIKVYVDGVLSTTNTSASGTLGGNSSVAYIGRDVESLTTPFSGNIDEVKMYNYARTSAQIMFDYNKGGPVGYWKFDEGVDNTCVGGTNDACNSGTGGSSLDGANANMASPATSTSGWTNSGKYGKAVTFDGSNDVVVVTDSSVVRPENGSWSMSVWAKPGNANQSSALISKRQNSGNIEQYSLSICGDIDCSTSGQNLLAIFRESGAIERRALSTVDVADGNWHYYAMVADKTADRIKIYMDGTEIAQTSIIDGTWPTVNNTDNLRFGNDNGSVYYNNALDEVKIFNFALSTDEVKIDYNRGNILVLGAEDTGAKISGGSGSAPLAHWDFNDKTGLTAVDRSGSGINGTLEGGARWTTGKYGSGIYFDGVDDRVNIGDVTTFDSQSGLSISLWTKISTLATARRLVSKWTTSQSTFMISLDDTNSDELIMAVSDGAHYDVFSTTDANLTTNTWYHIEMTWTDTTRAIYVNGVSKTLTTTLNQTITGTNNSSEPLQIGDSGETTPFNGYIDDVKIYNYVRPQGLVAYDYNRGAPIGHWPLDECQGTTATDFSPSSNGNFNGHSGTVTIGGSGTYTSAGACNSGTSTEAWNGGTTGKINSALGFDGTNDYVEIAYTASLAPSVNISFGGWFYTADKTQTSQSILSKTQGGGYNLFLNNTGGACGSTTSLCGLVNVNSSYYAVDYPVSNLSNNTWYHAMVTFNGSIVKLYLNGQLVDSKPASGQVTYTVTNALCIGAEPGNTVCDAGSPFNGKLDDIRVYNYDLSPTQIKEVYNQGSLYFGPSTGTP